jgi:hypothetical protein
LESGVGRSKGEVRGIMSWDITARGITVRGIMARGIRFDETVVDRTPAKWYVRVSKQSCKQANRLILRGVRRFFLFFFLQKNLKNMI